MMCMKRTRSDKVKQKPVSFPLAMEKQISDLAKENRRSFSAQVVFIVAKAIESEKEDDPS